MNGIIPPASREFSPLRLNGSPPSYGDWGTIFAVIASAILGRRLHRSTTINIKGESCRLKDRKKAGVIAKTADKKGGVPKRWISALGAGGCGFGSAYDQI